MKKSSVRKIAYTVVAVFGAIVMGFSFFGSGGREFIDSINLPTPTLQPTEVSVTLPTVVPTKDVPNIIPVLNVSNLPEAQNLWIELSVNDKYAIVSVRPSSFSTDTDTVPGGVYGIRSSTYIGFEPGEIYILRGYTHSITEDLPYFNREEMIFETPFAFNDCTKQGFIY